MSMASISKALAGAAAGAAAGVGTATVVIPPGVDVPWWGYLAVGVFNAAVGFLAVYAAPANKPVR